MIENVSGSLLIKVSTSHNDLLLEVDSIHASKEQSSKTTSVVWLSSNVIVPKDNTVCTCIQEAIIQNHVLLW